MKTFVLVYSVGFVCFDNIPKDRMMPVVGRIVRFVVFYPIDTFLNRKAKGGVRNVVEFNIFYS